MLWIFMFLGFIDRFLMFLIVRVLCLVQMSEWYFCLSEMCVATSVSFSLGMESCDSQ